MKDLKSSKKLWEGEWLHTGDLATIDADDYVKITDWLKDVIKSGGEWISSLQLEDLILRHPGVAEVGVIGVPDPKWIERPLALFVAKPGQQVSEAHIRGNRTKNLPAREIGLGFRYLRARVEVCYGLPPRSEKQRPFAFRGLREKKAHKVHRPRETSGLGELSREDL